MKTTHLLLLPEEWSEELKQACMDYYNHRKQTKYPMTDVAWKWFRGKIQRLVLSKYTDLEIIEAIMKAVMNNWRDIYLEPLSQAQQKERLMMYPEKFYHLYTEDERSDLLNS
jgi:hypothetical protein